MNCNYTSFVNILLFNVNTTFMYKYLLRASLVVHQDIGTCTGKVSPFISMITPALKVHAAIIS